MKTRMISPLSASIVTRATVNTQHESLQPQLAHAVKSLLLLMVGSLLLVYTARAQTPTEVNASASAYSPSIVCIPGTNNQVSAYTVENPTTGKRTIQVDVSSDNGVTWRHSDHTLPSAPTSIGGTNACMDEPELALLGTNTNDGVVLMFRAWDPDPSYEAGNENNALAPSYHGQHGTIFWHSGVYYVASNNPLSQTGFARFSDDDWGWNDLSGTFHTAAQTLEEITSNPSGNPSLFATLDHPRLASRVDYISATGPLYCGMIWEKRIYKRSTGNIYNGSDITSSLETAVITAKAFGALLFGVLLPQGTSSGPTFTSRNFGTSPMRADIALAPDGTFWISYYVVSSFATSEASYFLHRMSLGVSSGVATLSFANTSYNIASAIHIYLPGVYDNWRGYFYSEEYKLSVPDPDHKTDHAYDHKLDGSSDGYEWNVDLAQGPSIEVVTTNFNDCSPSYRVGVVYTETKSNDPTSPARMVRPPRFWCWSAAFDPSLANNASSLWTSELLSQLNPSSSLFNDDDFEIERGDDIDTVIGQYVHSFASSGVMNTMGLFPRLKYTGVSTSHWRDNFTDRPIDSDLPFLRESFFTLTYIHVQHCTGDLDNLDFAYTKTAVSGDNISFHAMPSSTPPIAGNAQLNLPSPISTRYWGSKLSAGGQKGDFEISPMWHSMSIARDPSKHDDIQTNTGGAIDLRGFLEGYPYSIPEAEWPVSFYFDFNDRGRPTALIPPAFFTPTVSSDQPDPGTYQFDYLDPAASYVLHGTTNYINYGIYFANYKPFTKTNFGWLGFSDQRKIVMTGVTAHAVFEDQGRIYYTMSAHLKGDKDRDWTQPVQLNAIAPSFGVTQARPSIAVYENGDAGSAFSGQAAIAVTWYDYTTNDDSLKVRTREFDVCKGEWGAWSPVYTVNALNKPSSSVGFGRDSTTPVIAPLLRLHLVGTASTLSDAPLTDFVGWTVTWTGPLSSGLDALQSRTLLRDDAFTPGGPLNGNWGSYPAANGAGILTNTNRMIPLLLSPAPNVLVSAPAGTLLSFPTVVNDESKIGRNEGANGAKDLPNNDFCQEVSYTQKNPGLGVYVLRAGYKRYNTVAIGGLILPLLLNPKLIHGGVPKGMGARNSCVTINSNGQRALAWEEASSLFPAIPIPRIMMQMTGSKQSSYPWGLNPIQVYQAFPPGGGADFVLRNPSLTGYPRTKESGADDPFAFDLFFSYNPTIWHFGLTPPNELWHILYKDPSKGGVGWEKPFRPENAPDGAYPEASFSPYSVGPLIGTPMCLANTKSSLSDWTTHPLSLGSYRGTYDSAQAFAAYRAETHFKDSLWTSFILGDLWVNDSSASLFRQVKMHYPVDTSNFSTSTQERDSVFCSEWFDVPIGSKICYFRGLYAPVPLPDVVASTLTDPSLSETFIVQLVHSNGRIDTLETLVFTPGTGDPLHPTGASYIPPKNASTLANTSSADTVQLRVKAVIAGFADVDAMLSFEMITAFDRYTTSSNTTVAYKSGGSFGLLAQKGHLAIAGPFPNPAVSSFAPIRALVQIPAGLIGKIELLDILGRTVASLPAMNGTGGWESISFHAPSAQGIYFLRVVAGSESKLLPISVVR